MLTATTSPLWQGVQARESGWRRIGAPRDVLRWVRHGVDVRFASGRPPPRFHMGNSTIDPEARAWWSTECERYLATGALERTKVAKYVSRAFAVPKSNGGWRLVVDLRPLNRWCAPMPCRYGALRELRTRARKGDYMVSFDLADGYHHVPIRPDDRKYFTFMVDGELYRCAGLPFGWNHSPAIFTRFMQPVVKQMKKLGAKVIAYLDDFLLMFPDEATAWRGSHQVRALLEELGLHAHATKSEWTPGQEREHLGMVVDLAKGEFRVSKKRMGKIRAAAGHVQVEAKAHARRVPARLLASFIGLAASCQLAVPEGRLYLRELYNVVETRRGSWSSPVRLTRQALRDLDYWRGVAKDGSCGPIWLPAASVTLHCDSSDFAWGGVLNNKIPVQGAWDAPNRHYHITIKEMRAVRLTIEHFGEALRGRVVHLFEDNQAVQTCLTTWTSRSPQLMSELRRIWGLLRYLDATMQVSYIRSEANTFADQLSRTLDRGGYSLQRRIYEQIDARYGPHTVDRFASPSNAQCQRYNTLLPTPGSEGADAFAQSWAGENNYAFPPIDELPRTLQFIRERRLTATVVAPLWPSAVWWQTATAEADSKMFIHEQDCLYQINPDERLPALKGLVVLRYDGSARN